MKAIAQGASGKSVAPEPSDSPQPALEQGQVTDETLRALFSEDLWDLICQKRPVKLDMSIGDRLRIRNQGLALKRDLGYQINPTDQTFYPV
jgi:hypothetical protein